MEKQIFRIGDRVYDFYYGWGTITAKREDFENTDYIWVVTFENGYIEDYTIEGKYEITDKFRSLSFTEYDFVKGGFSQERQINYEEYIDRWGKFWNEGDKVVIDILAEIDTKEYGRMVFGPWITNMYYDNFEPLTDEQLKVLGLK